MPPASEQKKLIRCSPCFQSVAAYGSGCGRVCPDRDWTGQPGFFRRPSFEKARAQRAKMKSRKDETTIAPDKAVGPLSGVANVKESVSLFEMRFAG